VSAEPPLLRACIAEAGGTFILVFFGVGAVHAAVLSGAQAGLWQVAVVWAVAVSLAIYATGAVSGAHINPAITVAMAVSRGFPWRRVGPYVSAQVLGGFAAAVVLHGLYGGAIEAFESANDLVRGAPGSELSAMVYGEYFPNPAVARAAGWSADVVSHHQAMLAEAVGTMMLALFVFALTDSRNHGGPGEHLTPIGIGLGVAMIISIIAPLTQAALNPARDFGPRLFAFLAGWGDVAIPGPRGGFFTVYILAPVVGAVAGGLAYQYLLHRSLVRSKPAADESLAPAATHEADAAAGIQASSTEA
jgi:glycerol uptake facilitator protein